MSYTCILLHVVFATKDRKPTLEDNNHQLYRYIAGITKNKKVHLIEINGTRDHLHLLISIDADLLIADFMRDVKRSTSKWLRASSSFPKFMGWAEGYGAFSVSYYNKDICVRYIKKQKEHHKTQDSKTEYLKLIKSQDCEYEEKYII